MTWPEIDHHISQITGEKFVSNQHLSISGGCINQSYTISNGKITYFVKLNQPSQQSMFTAEMLSLQQIYNTKTIRVPKPICWGITGTSSYIVLEWLEMTNGNHQSWSEMGRKLAAMHKITTNKGFGWDINNTIGATPQINNFHASWPEFYTQNRLSYQFQLAKKRGGNFPLAAKLL
ncbi:MAG: fructosamine kinase family protein, partial [Dolichospermum sp.]